MNTFNPGTKRSKDNTKLTLQRKTIEPSRTKKGAKQGRQLDNGKR